MYFKYAKDSQYMCDELKLVRVCCDRCDLEISFFVREMLDFGYLTQYVAI